MTWVVVLVLVFGLVFPVSFFICFCLTFLTLVSMSSHHFDRMGIWIKYPKKENPIHPYFVIFWDFSLNLSINTQGIVHPHRRPITSMIRITKSLVLQGQKPVAVYIYCSRGLQNATIWCSLAYSLGVDWKFHKLIVYCFLMQALKIGSKKKQIYAHHPSVLLLWRYLPI